MSKERIHADWLSIGRFTEIERDCSFEGWSTGRMKCFEIGDCGFIGAASKFKVDSLRVGDYAKIHNNVLMLGGECAIGHNPWIGQYTVLDSSGGLTLGNNVRIGMGSYVWSHVASGELLEGCNIYGRKPVVIEDDVWLVGNVVVSPGVTLAKQTIVLPGSVVAKDTETKRCYSGIPAIDITEKVTPYRDMTLDGKYTLMKSFIDEFAATLPNSHRVEMGYGSDLGEVLLSESQSHGLAEDRPIVLVVKNASSLLSPSNVSVFDLNTKRYSKKLSPLEIRFMKYLVGFRARFIPG
jgi:acetyltransferase-like isoleucine patch superfamily enzyme